MIDYSDNDIIEYKDSEKKNDTIKMNYPKVVLLIIMSYGMFYPIVNSGQSNGKLFIQQELLKSFNVEKTALIIGAILCVSRIVRVVSNIVFNKIYI